MSNTTHTEKSSGFGLMHARMAICCAVMLLPIGAFLLAGGTIAGLFTNLGLFASIALCVGVHAVMFAVVGNSCHGKAEDKLQTDASQLKTDGVFVNRLRTIE